MAFLLRGTRQLGVNGDGVLRDRGPDYDRPSRFLYISRALERPLILHRLEKPEIKKRNMRRYIRIRGEGEIPERETACRRARNR